jgi:outer membrane receptor protein involved in Fe transport
MMKLQKTHARWLAVAGTAALALSLLAGPAMAQKAKEAPAAAAVDEADIIVTGSRIKRDVNIGSPIPVTAISADQLVQGTSSSLGDALNNLPSLRSTYSLGNSSRFIGTAGVNFLDLRGLGTNRTLVLINGRRQVGSLQGSGEVDINTISEALLERVEVTTGGASAVYGSDAVSGVVNFITKRNFDGLAFSVDGGGATEGGARKAAWSFTGGKNFSEGRGNIAASVEYDYRQNLRFDQRDFSRNNDQFVSNPANINTANDDIPDSIFVRNTHSIAFSDGGTVCQAGNCRTLGVFRFRPDGSLTPADLGTRDFRRRVNGVTNGNRLTEGGDGSNFNRTEELLPETRRYSANILLNYEFSPAFKFSGEGKFVRTLAKSFSGGPAFNGLGNPITASLDNPYLTPQAIGTLQTIFPGIGPTDSFTFQRNNVDFGSRGEEDTRDLYRFSGAFSGDITPHLNYELSYTYSESKLKLKSLNNRVEQRFVNAVDAVRDVAGVLGTPGAIVCRSTLAAGNRNTGDFDVDKCVPVNIFGEGNPDPGAVSFINTTSQTRNTLQQHVVTGFLSGDTGGFFKLPGGPVGLVAGFEYRKDTSKFEVPTSLNGVPGDTTGINLLRDGLTFLNALQDESGSVKVFEGFGEISLPLLKDTPFAKELSVDAAIRVAHYSNKNVGTVYAWKVGGQYAPIRDIRLRVNYAQSVRAPGVTELFGPTVQNFFSVTDPCDVENIGSGTATRAANCAALGIPAGFVSDLTATPEGTSGGNPDLRAETSRSFTAGVLIQPRFIPGLSLSADYYSIRIDKAISSVAGQDIIDQCVDAATINNAFCPLVTRAGAGNANIAQYNIAFIRQRALNFVSLVAKGIDFELNYRKDLGRFGKIELRNLATLVTRRDDFPFIAEPTRPDQFLQELGDPKFQSNFSLNWTKNEWEIDYQLRFIGDQLLVNAEDVFTVGGLPPENPDAQDILRTGTTFYHDIKLAYNFNKGSSFYVSVDNVFNKKPPFGLTGTGGGSAIFDNIGRYVQLGLKAKF